MTIKDEITRIKTNIANAYINCLNKGAVMPEVQNSQNLAITINSIPNNGNASKYNLTMDNIFGDVDAEGVLQQPKSGDLIANDIKRVEDYALACKFSGDVLTVQKSQGIISVSFPDLTYIGTYALAYFCTYTEDLKTVVFPELTQIGQQGMFCGFHFNTSLISISFPKLISCSQEGLSSVCTGCVNLESVNLDSLTNLSARALNNAFAGCKKLKTLSFPSLTPASFNGDTTQFNNMLNNVSGCTVHFPYAIKKVIGEWEDVIDGFGGRNTEILFDLHAVYLNFISNKENIKISVNEEIFAGTSGYAVAGDIEYTCYSSDDNLLLIGRLQDLEEYKTYDINVDFNQSSNKITLDTGIAGLNVDFYIDNLKISATEEANGKYVLNVIGSNKDIKYFVNGGDNYSDAEGTISLTNKDITEKVTLYPVTLKTFVRPNISENGELGGDNFAVSSTGDVSPSCGAYNAFNGSTGDYWWASEQQNSITFYNPSALKISSLTIKYFSNSKTYLPSKIVVQGSNDNINWDELANFGYVSGMSRTLEINSSRFYKYHRLILVRASVYIRITEIEINASYKE